MRDLLLPVGVVVSAKSDLVLLQLGSEKFSLEFQLALRIAAGLRYFARVAMLNSGRDMRGIHLLGTLHDAAAPKPKRKRFIDRLPELLRPHQVSVDVEGSLVVLKIRYAAAKMPYESARALSQWIRVRGKEAKRNAGEATHWSRLVDLEAAAAGARAW